MKKETKTWLLALIIILAASAYPLYMLLRVLTAMATAGSVDAEAFPKYIIPYAPIALAVTVSVALLPLLKKAGRFTFCAAALLGIGIFFIAEMLLEQKVIVTTTVVTTLESWQMYMCYIPPESIKTRQWAAIDVLMGEYSPTFKLHFYLISLVLIIAILGCVWGFTRPADTKRRKALIAQSVSTALFLGLCILACFTAFYRDGELTVSPLSAFLMALFFTLLGTTAGSLLAACFVGRSKGLSLWLPAAAASAVTLAMYVGEMFLLSGHLYLLGDGLFFKSLPGIVLSCMDLLIILLPGLLTALLCALLNGRTISGQRHAS